MAPHLGCNTKKEFQLNRTVSICSFAWSRVAQLPGSSFRNPLSFELFTGVELGKLLPKVSDFRRIVIKDVWIVGMTGRVILMVRLGGIKGFQGDNLRHN